MKKQKNDFIASFYRWLLIWGGLGCVPAYLSSQRPGLLGFVLGFFFIGLIVGLWDLTLRFRLRPTKTSVVWETLLIFVRYGLIGGLVYAMIRWLVVSWPWFFAGVATILPGLLTTTVLFKDKDGASEADT